MSTSTPRGLLQHAAQIAVALCVPFVFGICAPVAKAGEEIKDAEKVPMAEIQVTILELTPEAYQKHKKMLDESIKPMTKKDRDAFMSKLEGIRTKDERETFMTRPDEVKGCDLLAAPKVIAKNNTPAKIEIVRELRFPTDFQIGKDGKATPTTFDQRDCGIVTNLTPSISGNKITIKGDIKVTDFTGFITGPSGTKTPCFNIRIAHLFREINTGLYDIVWFSTPDSNKQGPHLAMIIQASKIDF